MMDTIRSTSVICWQKCKSCRDRIRTPLGRIVVTAANIDTTSRHTVYMAALEHVLDPEVPVLSVVAFGMVRGVSIKDDGGVEVALTPTYTGCPATKLLEENIKSALMDAGAQCVRVVIQLSPAWTTDWMSEAGREKLKAYGIAPPVGKAGGRAALLGLPEGVGCPQGGSANTKVVSEFGSTACKALYQCSDCLEPFDYFKCI